MNLLIVGNDSAFIECKARLGEGHQYRHAYVIQNDHKKIMEIDVVFDFSDKHTIEAIQFYTAQAKTVVFLNTVLTTLSQIMAGQNTEATVFGFCGLPTFFNREVLEVTVPDRHRAKLDTIIEELGVKCITVKDQVGFVTPRVVCMIINEAYDALKSGVASREDIDLSMKLGTNYPFGPFEWSEKIGIDVVRTLLKAVEDSTGDSRYRPVF